MCVWDREAGSFDYDMDEDEDRGGDKGQGSGARLHESKSPEHCLPAGSLEDVPPLPHLCNGMTAVPPSGWL